MQKILTVPSDEAPVTDFTQQCFTGLLNGYVKVVDNIIDINVDVIKMGSEDVGAKALVRAVIEAADMICLSKQRLL